MALIDPSGSGKSTLLNTLGGLDRPAEGSGKLDQQEAVTMTENQRATFLATSILDLPFRTHECELRAVFRKVTMALSNLCPEVASRLG